MVWEKVRVCEPFQGLRLRATPWKYYPLEPFEAARRSRILIP